MNNNKKTSSLKTFIIDFLPLIVFFTVFKLSKSPKPIIDATIALVVVTTMVLIIDYIINKHISMTPLFSALILGFFGGLTIFSGNEIFIKIKPTIINSCFAIFLFAGYFFKKPLLKYIFGAAMEISYHAWMVLSLRWGCFFVFLAILNEIIWRNFSTEFWVKFKVFGMLPCSIIFALINTPYIIKQVEKFEKGNQTE
jgi:intracellular septation protein